MIVIENDNTTYIDVDDTLVVWGKGHLPEAIEISNYGHVERMVPHQAHINFLKRQKTRGFAIIVWSQGGARWAHNVVKALGIEEYVDAVLTKPTVYVDDLRAEDFMTQRIYFQDKKANPESGNVTEEQIVEDFEYLEQCKKELEDEEPKSD